MSELIRIARVDDYEAVCTLYKGLDKYHVEVDPNHFRSYEGPARTKDRFLELLNNPDWFFYVSEQGATLNGFVNGYENASRPLPFLVPQRLGLVQNLYVSPSARGVGLGKALMAVVEAWARKRQLGGLELDVIANNTLALQFYEMMGFERTRIHLKLPLT